MRAGGGVRTLSAARYRHSGRSVVIFVRVLSARESVSPQERAAVHPIHAGVPVTYSNGG
ncbi:hypothetical protein GCM10011588_49270 [Nocardia jinanensis]|uniref:Uncharacterized protein n=1 Tax=Nocardia jinanensis TaxID=382504 RepID=A0A917RTH3_9NOCA|nr:hypothetical protein GCM10011588_49270 [Nocardia jinanensis]